VTRANDWSRLGEGRGPATGSLDSDRDIRTRDAAHAGQTNLADISRYSRDRQLGARGNRRTSRPVGEHGRVASPDSWLSHPDCHRAACEAHDRARSRRVAVTAAVTATVQKHGRAPADHPTQFPSSADGRGRSSNARPGLRIRGCLPPHRDVATALAGERFPGPAGPALAQGQTGHPSHEVEFSRLSVELPQIRTGDRRGRPARGPGSGPCHPIDEFQVGVQRRQARDLATR
jgi:hypothetical protein